jgi:lipopolysaccharide/colanic/teichoic acid biosynthesis glycosyltransferase
VSRALDVIGALLAMVIAAPVMLVAVVLIHIEGGGKAIYRQTRVGLNGTEFQMRKLRTMVHGSDPVGVGTVVARDDPRVTRIGRFLRRTSLDELPNLINVLRGEMALVGPRPTIPAQVAGYTDHQKRRHEVLPGITGWAQVQGRAGIPWEERIELDIEYVDNRSLAMDLKILWKTIWLTVTGHGLAPD